MTQLNPDGSLMGNMQLMIAKGFKVGDMVRRRHDKAEGQFVDVQGENVILQAEDASRMMVSCAGFLKGEWVVFKATVAETEFLRKFSNPLTSHGFLELEAKRAVQTAINGLYTKRLHDMSKVYMTTKPKKEVFSACKVTEGSLCIVPVTLKLNFQLKAPGAALEACGHSLKGYHCVMSPMREVDKEPIPFWHVSYSKDPDEVNMTMATMKINGLTIPVMKNSRALKPDERLVLLKVVEKKQVDELVAMTEADEDENADKGADSSKGSAKGKSRKRKAAS
jgi:hypothetical protein